MSEPAIDYEFHDQIDNKWSLKIREQYPELRSSGSPLDIYEDDHVIIRSHLCPAYYEYTDINKHILYIQGKDREHDNEAIILPSYSVAQKLYDSLNRFNRSYKRFTINIKDQFVL